MAPIQWEILSNLRISHKYLAQTVESPINGLIRSSFLDLFLASKSHWHVSPCRLRVWGPRKTVLACVLHRKTDPGSLAQRLPWTPFPFCHFLDIGICLEGSSKKSHISVLVLGLSSLCPLAWQLAWVTGNDESTRLSLAWAGYKLESWSEARSDPLGLTHVGIWTGTK